jgi:periplasmic protein TonB
VGWQSALCLSPTSNRERVFVPGLNKSQWMALVLAIAGLHLGAVWCVLQIPAVRQVVHQSLPVFVRFVSPAPALPLEAKPPPRPTTGPALPPKVVPRSVAKAVSPIPAPVAVPESTTAAPPAPPALEKPALPQAQTPLSTTPLESPSAASTPPPPPRNITSSEVAYLVPPVLQYPQASSERQESGTVLLKVLIGEDGKPRAIKVSKSSGYVRLDEAAINAIQKTRFKPPTSDGQPVSGYAQIPLTFELEN